MANDSAQIYKIAILGASGYTGAELMRLIATHPNMRIEALSADRKAGMAVGETYPHLAHLDLPVMTTMDAVDFSNVDLAFCALPHALTQAAVKTLPRDLKIVDLSADFRLDDPAEYAKWYGGEHQALDLQAEAVYGLPEFYRDQITSARLVANTGCHVATGLLPLLPLAQGGLIDLDHIIIDSKSGVSGAGRAAKEAMLFCEVAEGFQAYAVGGHRHMAEFDQELAKAAGRPVTVSFTPHLVPMNRGLYATIYVRGDAAAIHTALVARYADEPFVDVLAPGAVPQSRHVRGSNRVKIGVVPDRVPGRTTILSTLDNLVKGASGQAIQNANLMLGLPETAGLELAPVFP